MSTSSRFSAAEFRQWLDQGLGHFFAASSAHPEEALQRASSALSSESPPLLWMATSGTTSGSGHFPRRWIGHTRESLQSSALAVCEWLEVDRNDRWARALPLHHMGGLSIEIRSEQRGFFVAEWTQEWRAAPFAAWLASEKITLVSLVPTQLHDLVKAGIRCPDSVRAVIVGADRLGSELFAEARKLGWPVLPSYGMTETASMIACASPRHLTDPALAGELAVLSGVRVALDAPTGRLLIEAPQLFSGELIWDESRSGYLQRERKKGAWLSDDRVRIHEQHGTLFLTPLGRGEDFVKILGEGVLLSDLDLRAARVLALNGYKGEVAFATVPDERSGARLVLVLSQEFPRALELWNEQASGVERASELRLVAPFPRTELGKLQRIRL